MNPVQIVKYKQRKKLILGFGIVFTGLWLLLVFYLLTGNKEPIPTAHITVHAPSPVAAGSMPTATFRSSRRATQLNRQTASIPQWSYLPNAPKAMMGSTSMHVHQISSATVHSIGGAGGSGGGIYTTSGGSNSGKGIRTTSSSISFGGNLVALSASTAIAAPGAKEATNLASTTAVSGSKERPGRIKTTNGDPMDPFLDPVGDVAWGWMLLLTIAWCVRVRLSKRQ